MKLNVSDTFRVLIENLNIVRRKIDLRMLLSKIFKYITGKRIRQTLKHSLAISGTFYLLNMSYSLSALKNIKKVNLESVEIIQFITVYGLILFIFYPFLDFLLRLLFLKVMKKKTLHIIRKIKEHHKIESLRAYTEAKQVAVNFVLDYPVGLGYISSKDLSSSDPPDIKASNQEKEEAINEVIGQINKWICTLLHLLITSIVVFNYYPLLMYCFLGIGLLITPIVVIGIILLIENVELFGAIVKDLNRKVARPVEIKQNNSNRLIN